jgi:hypothetical protein
VETDSTAIEQLEARLERGWELIERAEAADDNRSASRYTRHWLELLADYERLCEPADPALEQESPS